LVNKRYADKAGKDGYQDCDAIDDFRELVARKDIDAVVIATPDHWHALTAIAAAKAGKDIYCEKPMSHTILEGRAMVKAVRKHKRILQVGSMQRSASEFRAACELIRNGALGPISTAEVGISGPPKPCDLPGETEEPGLDWNFWLGAAPLRPYNSILSPRGVHDNFPDWRKYREYGSGGIGDWGAHHFDIVQWALGFDDSGPVEFVPAEKPDAQHGVHFLYANGVRVNHVDGAGITFNGAKGKLFVDRGKFKLWLGDTLRTEDPKECGQVLDELLPPNAVRLYKSSNQIGDWITSMHTRKLPICDVETGHRTASVCQLVNLTYFHGQTLKWNPAKEKFTDHTGNAQWLGKEYRKPWKLG
jgi:predicted dehydrogenase